MEKNNQSLGVLIGTDIFTDEQYLALSSVLTDWKKFPTAEIKGHYEAIPFKKHVHFNY